MKHKSTIDNKMARLRSEHVIDAKNAIDSKPERMDPKAYARFKAMNTDYGTKKCFYGDQKNYCNPKCIFWMSCKHGKHESEWKGVGKSEQRAEKKE